MWRAITTKSRPAAADQPPNEQIKHQMEELRRQSEEFRLITENMSEGFLVVDAKTELLSYNLRRSASWARALVSGTPSVFTLNRGETFRHAVETALSGEHCEQSMTLGNAIYHVIANPVSHGGSPRARGRSSTVRSGNCATRCAGSLRRMCRMS